jgi:hypothetical protein
MVTIGLFCMRCLSISLPAALVLLFLLLSFNAYACVLPLFGLPQAMMSDGCTAPQEQPVRQFCDTFTTLGLHAARGFQVTVYAQVISQLGTVAVTSLMSPSLWTPWTPGHPAQRLPQNVLVRTTVLRI